MRSRASRIRLALLFFCALPASASDYLQELSADSRSLRLSEQREWRTLLHYTRRLFREPASEAAGAAFFLSESGWKDPQAELDADLAAFLSPPIEEDAVRQHPQCRFPARYAWLKEKLSFDPARLPEQPCPRFKEWRGDPESVTLVYADAYLSDPSSMFGHTFLRVEERGRGEDERLLDYSLNFGARTDEKNPLIFAVRGLTGGFPGTFSIAPFYVKVQEYSNIETRDLWEYRLSLSSRAVDRLMMHAWELGNTHFDYYFFTKNCSYQLLPLLEVAEPSSRLSDWHRLGVIPSDTVRAVMRKGLVRDRRYRPSLVSEMLSRREGLSPEERRLAGALGRDPAAPGLDALSPERQAAVLDSAYDVFRYRKGFYHDKDLEVQEAESLLLRKRSRLGLRRAAAIGEQGRPLEEGHDTARFGGGVGASEDGAFGELTLRGALHDGFARQDGYVRDSVLETAKFALRADGERKLYLQEATLMNVASFFPWDDWRRKPSWRISMGLHRAEELPCGLSSCLAFEISAGVGLSTRFPLPGAPMVYGLAELETSAGSPLQHHHRAGGGGAAGLMFELGPSRLGVEALHRRFVLGDPTERTQAGLTWAYHASKDLEARLSLRRRAPHKEMLFSLMRYF